MNCLSKAAFENLLFVDITVGSEVGTALFDSGAQKTAVRRTFLKKCKIEMLEETVKAGNNNGRTMTLHTAVLKSMRIADKELKNLEVVVVADEMFAMQDNQGHPFPADMLLGYDVIGKFQWRYEPTMRVLDICDSGVMVERESVHYNGFPAINITLGGQSCIAGIDTGHTETILRANADNQKWDIVYIEDEIVGVGSTKKAYVPMIPKLDIAFEGTETELYHITIQEEIYGAPQEMGCLLGMDFLEGQAWEMDFAVGAFRIHPIG